MVRRALPSPQEQRVPAVTADDLDHTWRRIESELRQAVPTDIYEIWLAPLRPMEIRDREIVVEAPRELRSWIAERFARVLQASAVAVLGPGAAIHVRPGDEGPPTTGARAAAVRRAAAPQPDRPEDDAAASLNPKYTFEQFVIGDANRFAHAAALAVAELPGQAYNPLFIYGPPGVGKTHLLHSIGNYIRACDSTLSVRYTTVETFTNQFIAAISGGSIDRFKGRFRRNDVLLIDDVQFLASKVKTEEEFFHTFNALYESGSQLVLTSDRTPRDLEALEDRLRERFEAGLVTAIKPPDIATRLTVLRKRAHHDHIALDDDVLTLIAERVPTNIRALEGALIRVVAFASLTGRAVDRPLALEVLSDLYPPGMPAPGTAQAPTIERIQELTAEAFGLSCEELLSQSRRPRLAWPRQVAMYLAREHTSETLPAIAARFGGRNHTTVMHACRRTAERIASDPEAFDAVRRLTERLASIEADRRG
ncbi:MAG: chromosomal replication initiator protein [Solirubrobacteraceae bacterium]|nr:chromosomal replication initiator protein [Solirubrobacteraceae bacterium]